ncbi:MAG: DinB family protein [Armatimonadota bacterium]|jgi:uncharacterized damage-inducible protein DinB
MAQDGQLGDIQDITGMTYEQLRRALEPIPDDQMTHKAADLATTPAEIAIHACSADLHYSNVIDGGSRRVPIAAEDEPSRDALLRLIDDTEHSVRDLLAGLDDAALDGQRQVWRHRGPATVRFVLLHMLRHKHYHTGQLNYIHFLLGIDER